MDFPLTLDEAKGKAVNNQVNKDTQQNNKTLHHKRTSDKFRSSSDFRRDFLVLIGMELKSKRKC